MTLVAIALLAAAAVVRSRLVREAPQSARITRDPELNYLYGSIDADERGLPYWVVVVLPRVFGREYLPGPGGYAALGLAWPEGTELPAGFAKQTIGVERVTFNCALCHTAQRVTEHATPKIVAGRQRDRRHPGPAGFFHTVRRRCAVQRRHDPDGD